MNDLIYYLAQQLASPESSTPVPSKTASGPFDQFGFLMIGMLFIIMYFLLIRPQRKEEKRKKGMLNLLAKGDKVVTSSGIVGTVATIKEDTIFLNVGDGHRIEFLRSAIANVKEKELPSMKKQ